MIHYDYFSRKKLSVQSSWSEDWDLLLSSWDNSARVKTCYELATAKRKLWLVHPEYGIAGDQLPAQEYFSIAGDEAEGIQALLLKIEELGVDFKAARIAVDITGMLRPHIALLTRFLQIKGCRKFDAIYAEPTSYPDRENTKFTSGDVIEVREVIGFEGHNRVSQDREVLIVAPGFDDVLLREIVSHKERAERIQIFGLPSLQPDMYQHNVLKALGVDTPLPEETKGVRHFASAFDPFAMATELSSIVSGYRMRSAATRFYVAPLATKPQMLGAALFYLTECRHGMLSILYPISSSHVPGPSVGISRAWLFKIDFDLCDSLGRRSQAIHA
ncbi:MULTISPECIES: hypothetical protein [unclassified Bradyrhizobium]|uniref:hypothetical protein n=1 Tax=unclassified Bradyrhizobium TaxID=2631580 RepID=UPI001FF89F44|nr:MULTISPECIES: hypothetical protein [unclassified Bradyrhizobium]MCK1348623.1 hypothetical protein [Bradyrhizobium sp. CW11]MCK1506958.1 hypothetical protein [Bradyrhizobium sp. 18]MCK1570072.1 hypothetical protein [Bradyrhizobium sp. 173]UPJ84682.1 hypothetical protein IVB17_41190 [Bradyrhizobium sp. 184]UPJ92523.1 hypothetical protein IVB16_38945 [Bradyrhizobium sp. 183]